MVYQTLHIHEIIVLHFFKGYEQSTQLKPEDSGLNSHFIIIKAVTLIERLTAFTYHHTSQIIADACKQLRGACSTRQLE
ncbi:hypothetical protein [Candidatus Enterovibrio altilux]|uniref:hypothetical protein n=1 Tax=Candidatus Enterovibrio altilux TaxID=1927128 RepID=UPI000BBCEC14|nr:hypothetical protein [Candidatus Enterovibrio luxaltus]